MTSNAKRALLNNVLLSASLFVLDSLRRHRIRRAGLKPRDKSVDLDTPSNVRSQAPERDRTILANNRHFLEAVGPAIMGVGVGIGLGVMLAPASGKETRRNIEERIRSRFFEKKAD
jgi:hypothetical protein